MVIVDEQRNTEKESAPELSIVIPAYNEEENLAELYASLMRVLFSLHTSWEIIVTDDGSTDNTWSQIEHLHVNDERVKGVRLSRNFGHQYALLAGLHHATGDAVISMDADLQHPPTLIPKLLEEWRKGNKIVKTIRLDPKDYPLFKKITSRLFYKIFSYLSGVRLEDGMADYRLLDRQVVNDILEFREEGFFLRGLTEWVGYPSSSVPYPAEKRFSGVTKYTLRKMLRFAWHGVSSFSIVPLRIGVVIGLLTSSLSFSGVLYAIYGKVIVGEAVPGWASSVAIVSFLFGVLFIFLGLLGEYVGRIHLAVRQRPRFIVSEWLGITQSVAKSDVARNVAGRNRI